MKNQLYLELKKTKNGKQKLKDISYYLISGNNNPHKNKSLNLLKKKLIMLKF